VHLKEFSLVSAKIQSTEIFKAIETAIPATSIEQAIAKAKVGEERHRSLPAQLVVCLIIAMSLWSKDSMRDVLKNLIDGLTDAWVKIGKYWRTPCKSAITQARQRLGSQVMRELFHQLVRPMANSETVGAFINGLRIVVIDGTCLDIPDSNENARVFGRPSSRLGTRAAFPARQISNFGRGWNTFNIRRIHVPIPDWRASTGIKVVTLCYIRNVVNVGSGSTFLRYGASNSN
jgi:hypothetical protein